jgi:hypothetical protein
MERYTTQPTNLTRLAGQVEEGWDDRPTFTDPRMIALVMQQDRELRELLAFQAQERVRIGLGIRKERES